jgi:hypothetical protein
MQEEVKRREFLAQQFPAVEFVWIAEHPRTWTVKSRRT